MTGIDFDKFHPLLGGPLPFTGSPSILGFGSKAIGALGETVSGEEDSEALDKFIKGSGAHKGYKFLEDIVKEKKLNTFKRAEDDSLLQRTKDYFKE